MLTRLLHLQINLLTKGRPSPALAQLTPANLALSSSATGETKFDGGNTGVVQDGHW